jgi:preprotein translocase subunit SecD
MAAPMRTTASRCRSFIRASRSTFPSRPSARSTLAEQTFFFSDTWTSKTFQSPHVRLVFAPYIGARIHRLTSQIVGEELAIMVAGKIVIRPIVREPHGLRETFCIGFYDMKEAEALAAKLREGWTGPALRPV